MKRSNIIFTPYPVCLVCGNDTPTHTKSGKKIADARRRKTVTCGDPVCHGVMITRSRKANEAKKAGKAYIVHKVQPPAVTKLDKGFYRFNFNRISKTTQTG